MRKFFEIRNDRKNKEEATEKKKQDRRKKIEYPLIPKCMYLIFIII
jgi:hypothetical protein